MTFRLVEVDRGQIQIVDENDNKVEVSNSLDGNYRLFVDALSHYPAGAQFPASAYDNKLISRIISSDVALPTATTTTIYSRSGSGYLHEITFDCDSSDLQIILEIDGVNICDSGLTMKFLSDLEHHHTKHMRSTFIYLIETKDRAVIDFGTWGMKFNSSYAFKLRPTGGSKKLKKMLLWETVLS
jgi:hypothetical protein